MNDPIRLAFVLAFALLAAGSTRADASETPIVPPAPDGTVHVLHCDALARPSQTQVAAWTGQQGAGQVFAARQRLMANVSRLCKKPGVQLVRLVLANPPAARGPTAATQLSAASARPR